MERDSRRYVLGIIGTVAAIALWVVLSRSGDNSKPRSRGTDQRPPGGKPSSAATKKRGSQSRSRPTSKSPGSTSRVSKPKGKSTTSGVTETQGTVYVVSGNSRKPAKNTNPKPGDKVETGANSRAVLSIGDSSSQVEVGPNSELGIGLASSITGLVPNLNL